MSHLLDVNFLVALFDRWHVNHGAAHRWFEEDCRSDWATCSITELGCVRVLSNPALALAWATPPEVSKRLESLCGSGGHVFWPDDLPPRSSLDDDLGGRLRGHKQVTDFHLAALALCHGGRLVTFDGRLARSLAGSRLASAVMLVR